MLFASRNSCIALFHSYLLRFLTGVFGPIKFCYVILYDYYRVAQKNGASLSHCKYYENSMTELRGNW